MRKKLLTALFLLTANFSFSAELHIQDLSGGMNSYVSPNKIADNTAAYIQNFFTDIQPMAVERNGSVVLDANVGSNSKYIPGLWKFVDNSGNEWIIEYSSRTYYKHTVGNVPTAFGFNTTTSNIPRAATNLGKIMFVNGVDLPWTFDGTTSATVASAPIGSLVLAWRTRFVIANITGANSTVRFSADGSATNWTLGGLSTDPFAIQIGGANDGFRVLCIGNYLDYVIIQRKYDTWALSGFDQSDVQNRNISAEIGCIEPGTNREFDGSYLFLSWRGMEEMDGFNIKSISDPIRNITDILVKNTVNQRTNTQTSQSDWTAGTQYSTGAFSYTISPGNVQPPFPDNFTTYRNGAGGQPSVYTTYFSTVDATSAGGSCGILTSVGSVGISTGQLQFTNRGSVSCAGGSGTFFGTASIGLKTNEQLVTTSLITDGTTIQFYLSTMTAAGSGSSSSHNFYVALDQQGNQNFEQALAVSPYWYYRFSSTQTGTAFISNASNAGFDSSANLFSGNQFSLPTTFYWYLTGTRFQISVGNTVLKAGTHNAGTNTYFLGFTETNSAITASTVTIDNLKVVPASSSYTSQLIGIGTLITSWGPVTISDVRTDGTMFYQIGSTSVANIGSITNWQTITNGAIPTISTNPYAAFRSTFPSQNSLSGNNLFLSEFTITWNEGGAVPSPISINYDRRYWLSLTTTTSSSPTLDTVYIYQRNRTWTSLKGINAASFALWRDYLHFGDATSSGNVYQFDVGNNDSGNPITSTIITKSYDLGSHLMDKDYRRTYLTFLGGGSGSFTLGFYNDQSLSSYTLGTANMNDGVGQVFEKYHFPLDGSVPLQGREIQYVLNKVGSGDRLKLFDISLDFNPKEAR